MIKRLSNDETENDADKRNQIESDDKLLIAELSKESSETGPNIEIKGDAADPIVTVHLQNEYIQEAQFPHHPPVTMQD